MIFVAHVILQISNFYCDQPQSFFVTHVTVQISYFYWLAFVISRSCESFDFPFFGILFRKAGNVPTKFELCDFHTFLTLKNSKITQFKPLFNSQVMRRLSRNFNIPPLLGKPWAFELLKIGSFKFPPPPSAQNGFQMPYPIVGFCLSNVPPKEQSSSVPVVCNKACVYSRYTETSIQDGKLF